MPVKSFLEINRNFDIIDSVFERIHRINLPVTELRATLKSSFDIPLIDIPPLSSMPMAIRPSSLSCA